ncbi:hypothetical protein TUM20985_41670 [Mycobacterium antarcticum]|uniref:TIGR04222 domain-containing membrane protein n=1 Tax=Mycolicibacterium sp. TUM20985 TaxID=3023370 RepID=UPI00257369D9|nr:TIGR04222 domain-containing membrane protein [Mycolicibacterium sp. TUM20985]BDX33620.1 hypothetical protein TUM20985_41670 [Mycolicibacterium sp. TUM20985]
MHDVWGVSDHAFVMWFVVAATFVATASMAYRLIAFRGRPAFSDDVDAHQAAFLAGGPHLAVYSALGELRRTGAVGVNPDRVLSQVAPLPMDATRLERAVYEATPGHTAVELPGQPAVSATLARICGGLEESGLLLSPSQRASTRWFLYALLVVLGIGVARVAAELIRGAPVGGLFSALVVIGVFVTFMVTVPRRTRAGTTVLAELRRRHAHLTPPRPVIETGAAALLTEWRRRHPPQKPPLDAPGAAALAIGLFGTESLYAFDPVFASNVGAPRHRPTFDVISLGSP